MFHYPERGVEYDQFVVFRNPVSRNAKRIRQYLDHLSETKFGAQLRVIDTKQPGVKPTIDLLGKHVQVGDIIGSAGGDGTFNMFAGAMLEMQGTDIAQVPILPLWGGNRNDGANSLNPRRLCHNPERILRCGSIIPIRPLIVTLEHSEEQYSRLAVLYAGFGVTATAGKAINDRREEINGKSWLKGEITDYRLVLEGLRDAALFKAAAPDQDAPIEYLERLASNGPRMAGVFRPQVPLGSETWRLTDITDKRLGTLTRTIGSLLVGRATGQAMGANDSISFVPHSHILGQADGEHFDILPDTRVTVAPHTATFNAITTFNHY